MAAQAAFFVFLDLGNGSVIPVRLREASRGDGRGQGVGMEDRSGATPG